MKEILKKVLGAYGATGHEENVAGVISELVKPYVDEIKTDALGNLICVKHGAGKRVMIAAHMDHIGFAVTNIDDNGFLRVANVGGINRLQAINRHVVFENGVNGIVSCETEKFDPANVPMDKLFIDIGARCKKCASEKVKLGDVAVFASDIFELQNDLLASPAMDNRVGCAVAIGALKLLKEAANEVICVFTVQEEVGLRGARAAAYDIDPDLGIALDVTLCGDTPKGPKIAVKAGDGPCVKIMDNSLICSPKVVKLMEEVAEREGIPYQREVLTAGGTDAGAMQLTRGGVNAGVISIACRYVHSAVETVSVKDVENGAKLLSAILASEIS